MFYMNLHVLFSDQPHVSYLNFWHSCIKEVSMVCYDGLNTRHVMLILHEFKTGFVSHNSRPALISPRVFVEILHIDSSNPVII